MFRARVAAQAFTVVAMVAGGMYYAEDRHKQRELWKLKQQQEAEEKRQKWIRELEARDEEEKAFREKLDQRRKRAAERADQDTGTDGVAAQARAALREAKAAKPANAKQEATDSDPVEEEPSRAPDNGDKPRSGLLNSLNSLGGLFGRSKGTPEHPLQSPEDHRKPDSEK
jgi:septal ring factor EnvC (AmiA/AmiB activator)